MRLWLYRRSLYLSALLDILHRRAYGAFQLPATLLRTTALAGLTSYDVSMLDLRTRPQERKQVVRLQQAYDKAFENNEGVTLRVSLDNWMLRPVGLHPETSQYYTKEGPLLSGKDWAGAKK